ncbi:lyase [Canicola haemoglobinophilus]|uniref:Lyase n=1 Tax=Canicola haemoglobinophilus TaxID=733 RepID=A0AB38H8F3_9PAST|nr:VOC family protein [Canicola haemoglobinophilus]STO55593.1 lyase [Canicola haemoglobinophilus]STO67919.1 lyase [Canicola haemoglobinophilus]
MLSPTIIGFHHVAIIVSNYAKSKKFYTEILGASIINETYREELDSYKLDLTFSDGSQIELFSFPNPPERLSYPESCGLRHLAFKVNNIDNAVSYLKSKGIFSEPIRIDEITGKKFTFFKDPDNLPIEFYEL